MTNQMTITDYTLVASNGRRIRKATQVTTADGQVIRFMDKLTKREAIRNAELHIAREAQQLGMVG